MPPLRSAYTESLNFYGKSSAKDIADKYGTPLYVYNENILRERCRDMKKISDNPHFVVNYSVKANSNPELVKIIKSEGLTVDAMSPGELAMNLLAGYEPQDILYISNNITPEEMLNAISHGCTVSVDSLSQLEMLGSLKEDLPVMLRINPGIGEGHSAKVVTAGANTKFGIDPTRLPDALKIIEKYSLVLAGINQHIGSLFMDPGKYLAAAAELLNIADGLPEPVFKQLNILDFGGGFGIPYHKYDHEERFNLEQFSYGFNGLIDEWTKKTGYAGNFVIEPGRYVAAECGTLLGRVTSVKDNGHTRYVGTDIGFNVLQRPVMYDSFHDLEIYAEDNKRGQIKQTIVGNICESGDILAKNRLLPELRVGDLLGVLDTGAYGFSMASNYNDRLLPAEVLVETSGEAKLIRRRQTIRDLETTLVKS